MKKILITILLILLQSCGHNEQEFQKLKDEIIVLKQYKQKYNNLLNTPEQRLIKSQNYFSKDEYQQSKSEYKALIELYPLSKEAKIAKIELKKIQKIVEDKKKLEEKKKTLGFKILKPNYIAKVENVKIVFNTIKISTRWVFDRYSTSYMYRDSEKGDKYITANIKIVTSEKNPDLPPVYAYHIKNGKLKLLGTLKYEFFRWTDYGSYLGNYADYKNDFTHSNTIPFSLGLSVSISDIDTEPIFIVVGNENCFTRKNKKFSNPEIVYESYSCKLDKNELSIDDFDSDYFLIKTFNKHNL